MKTIHVTINGRTETLEVRDNELLVETLRDRLSLQGTKYSCLEGECGACTVLVNGRNMLSCLLLSALLDGSEIITIEGMVAADGSLHPIQQAFIDEGAVQCGFCTPGMVLATQALLSEDPEPDEEKIRRGLDGNLCRCTGYIKIIDAVRRAAQEKKGAL